MLKKLWNDGLSASQIAAQLAGGVTRNAVIGKVHRLGLSGRATTSRSSSPRPRRPRQPSHPSRSTSMPTAGNTALKPQAFTRPVQEAEPEPVPIRLVDQPSGNGRVTVLKLSDKTCRWPIGDPGSEEFCFCGHTPKNGVPYCDYHARVAYQPMQDRRSRRAAGGR
jgi:GcrA cell cycle regulator